VLLQASAGLFTSDFIFNEGPLVRHVSEAWVDVLSSLHHRLYWVVIALVSLHLSAHLVYALRRDAVVLGMFTGRKRLTVAPADHHLWRAALWTLSVAALLAASIWAL
jgi:cytochrome b